jgi:hypothetical protein
MGKIRLVVCCPDDVEKEKLVAKRVVAEVNSILDNQGSQNTIEPISWDTHSSPGFHALGSQSQVEEGLRAAARIVSQIWSNRIVPSRKQFAGDETE